MSPLPPSPVVYDRSHTLLLSRSPDQTFVWWSAENPTSVVKELILGKEISSYTDLYTFDGFFNATMTYRMESDFYGAYGSRAETLQGWKAIPYGKDVVDDIIKYKRNTAVSGCYIHLLKACIS